MIAVRKSILQPALALLALLVAVAMAGLANAQTYSFSIPASTPNLGTVGAASTGITTFRIDTSGNVTVFSGSGTRTSNSATPLTVTVNCGNQSQCSSKSPYIRVVATGSPSGRAGALTNFNVAMGTAVLNGSIT